MKSEVGIVDCGDRISSGHITEEIRWHALLFSLRNTAFVILHELLSTERLQLALRSHDAARTGENVVMAAEAGRMSPAL